VFGAKDFQQAAVVRRMIANLNFPVRMVVAPTYREPDGLAMSSRNKYLSAAERRQAVVLWHAIERTRHAAQRARREISAKVLKKQLTNFIEQQPAAKVDYIEFFDPSTLRPVPKVRPGAHMALAVFVGRTRLIDNADLR
jgi:pantoate--beta-alanine ligase